jgi:CDP-diacylglycerol--glycerol-3-phosphate 3-phosphatidyltransferase
MNLPNKLTLGRLFLSPVFMVLVLIENIYCRYAGLLVFAACAITDAYDGHLARKTGVVTNFGKFMDPVADKFLISMALIAFVAMDYVAVWMVMIIIAREFIITGLRSLAAYKGLVIYATGWAKVKTVMQMVTVIVILLMANLQITLSTMNHPFQQWLDPRIWWIANGLVFVTLILTVVTGLNYLIRNASLLRGILR